jgi:hypothetical protein
MAVGFDGVSNLRRPGTGRSRPDSDQARIQMTLGNRYLNLEPDAVSRRFWVHLAAVIAAGVILAAVFGTIAFAGSVALGGVLATINHRWLMGSVRGILGTGSTKVPPGTTMMFMFRWLIIAAAGFAAYRIAHVSAAGILTGLLAPAAAAVVEAAYLTFRSIGRDTQWNDPIEPEDNQATLI